MPRAEAQPAAKKGKQAKKPSAVEEEETENVAPAENDADASSAAWDKCIKEFEDRLLEEEDYDESYNLMSCFVGRVRQMFEEVKGLDSGAVDLLMRCTTIQDAGADYMDGSDVRGFKVHAQVFSVDGQNCVHVLHTYHSRCRNESVEHFAAVEYAVCAADEGPEERWKNAWNVSLKNTRTRSFRYAEQRRFGLTKAAVSSIRSALFPPGSPRSNLGAKISDYLMMQWVLGAAGYEAAGMGRRPRGGRPRGGECLEHTVDGWDGVKLRKVCGASTKEDAEWKEKDFAADIKEQQENEREQREEEREMKRCRGGRGLGDDDIFGDNYYMY